MTACPPACPTRRLQLGSLLAVLLTISHRAFCLAPEVLVSSALEPLTESAVADWGAGVIEATGRSSAPEPAPAIAASYEARSRAIENLRLAIHDLRLQGGVTLSAAMEDRVEFNRELTSLVTRADIVAEWQEDDGHVVAIARLDIWGTPSALGVLALRFNVILPQSRPASAAEQANGQAASVVVIDARDLAESPLQPCVLPRLLGAEAQPVILHSAERIRYRRALPLRYVRTREELHRLLGDREATYIRAIGADGCDIVLPESVALPVAEDLFILY
jgi:hypothetical protein